MRILKSFVALLVVICTITGLASCAASHEEERTDSTSAAVECVAQWAATWRQGSGANEWWVEYAIGGDTVTSAYLEVPGRANVTLRLSYGKWVGSTPRINTGTSVVVHAVNDSGEHTQSVPFRYLVDTAPATATCEASDGDAGTCAATWDATWAQGSGANEWWFEFSIAGGTVASAHVEIAGRADLALRAHAGKWAASTARITSGTNVILHAVNGAGQHTQTTSFRYLLDTAPSTASCGNPPPPPPPDAGTDAGTCTAWRPTVAQGSGANDWWVEYTIGGAGKTVTGATFEVAGRTVTLNPHAGKWAASSSRIEAGTNVVLRVQSSAGDTATTAPFRYLVDTAPAASSSCTPPPSGESGLDSRPSNTTCVAPAPPAASTSMIFTRVFPNVGPSHVMQIAQPPGDGSRWFILDREGKIWSFDARNQSATVMQVADFPVVSGKTVRTELSGGMLGFAFHPSFATNGRLYVSFTTTAGSGVASEVGYLRSTDGGRTFTSYTRVFGFSRGALEWNGGAIAFGLDGFLYLGFGASDSDGAQSRTSYFGKILRIDVDRPSDGRAYGIPPTNPFATGGGHPEIYAMGFRQPWRISFDRATGDLWSADAGQSSWEEVNRVERGKNYGWPCREGKHSYWAASDPNKCPSTSGLTDPITEYDASGGAAAIGGYVYRGLAASGFDGTYVYGDHVRQQALAFRWDAATGNVTHVPINSGGAAVQFTSFAEDDAGEIYATSNWQTGIFKLVPSGGGSSTFPDRLSKTGCFQPTDPKQPAAGVIPFRVNAPLWSDGLDKDRGLALPNGTRITVRADGDFDFPIGSVLTKTFSLAGRRIETRLFMRHGDGTWAGYSYEWNDAQTDAVLLPGGKTKSIGDRNWTFPSRTDCMRCHTSGAGFTLGLELGQLNADLTYPSTGRTANQLDTLEHIGMFASALPAAPPAYPTYDGTASVDARTRSYLHANCSGCHRPSGGAGRSTIDARFGTSFAGTNMCGATPVAGDLGVAGAKIVDPGSPASSILSMRVHRLDGFRMPPLGTQRVDPQGVDLIDAWIRGIPACP